MKRILPVLLAGCMTAQTAFAGAPADPVIEAPVIVEETRTSSGGVAIPLLLLALAVIAIADSSSAGGVVGGSDERLKTDIRQVGVTAHDLPLYRFSYIGVDGTYEGVMAQDVAKVMPGAVKPFAHGFLAVDYGMLGIEMRRID